MKKLIISLSFFMAGATSEGEVALIKPSGICINGWWNNLALTQAAKQTRAINNCFGKTYTPYLGGLLSWETITNHARGISKPDNMRTNDSHGLKHYIVSIDDANLNEKIQKMEQVAKARIPDHKTWIGQKYYIRWLDKHNKQANQSINFDIIRREITKSIPPFVSNSASSQSSPLQTSELQPSSSSNYILPRIEGQKQSENPDAINFITCRAAQRKQDEISYRGASVPDYEDDAINEPEEAASDDEECSDESEDTASTSTDSNSNASSGSSSPSPVRAAQDRGFANPVKKSDSAIDLNALQKLEVAPPSYAKKQIKQSLSAAQKKAIRPLRAQLNRLLALEKQKSEEYRRLEQFYINNRTVDYQVLGGQKIDEGAANPRAQVAELLSEVVELQNKITAIRECIKQIKKSEIPVVRPVDDTPIAPITQPATLTSLGSSISYAKNSYRMPRASQVAAMMSNHAASSSSASANIAQVQDPVVVPSDPVYHPRDITASLRVAAYLNNPTLSEECRKRFATLMNKGDEVVWKLVQGQTPDATDRGMYLINIIRLTWRLYAHALDKGQGFEEGTFYLPTEEGQKIFDYLRGYVELVKNEKTPGITGWIPGLSGNPFAYERPSSHYNDSEDEQYGIDICFNPNQGVTTDLLPEGKTHILFGKRFIKIENYGLSTVSDCIGHAGEFVFAQGRKVMPAIFGSDDQVGYKKERVPLTALEGFKKMLLAIDLPEAEAVGYYATAKKHGIKDMYKISKALLAQYENKNEKEPLLIYQFICDLEENYGEKYIEQRTGNEVMLGNSLFKPSFDSQQQS